MLHFFLCPFLVLVLLLLLQLLLVRPLVPLARHLWCLRLPVLHGACVLCSELNSWPRSRAVS
jgi:hypothetical protein